MAEIELIDLKLKNESNEKKLKIFLLKLIKDKILQILDNQVLNQTPFIAQRKNFNK